MFVDVAIHNFYKRVGPHEPVTMSYKFHFSLIYQYKWQLGVSPFFRSSTLRRRIVNNHYQSTVETLSTKRLKSSRKISRTFRPIFCDRRFPKNFRRSSSLFQMSITVEIKTSSLTDRRFFFGKQCRFYFERPLMSL